MPAMTYVIKYTQGSGPISVTLRGYASEAAALAYFWGQSHIKQNPKVKVEKYFPIPAKTVR